MKRDARVDKQVINNAKPNILTDFNWSDLLFVLFTNILI